MKNFKDFIMETVKEPTGDLKKACWKGYTAVGMKKKDGRKVPNCVPVKEETSSHVAYLKPKSDSPHKDHFDLPVNSADHKAAHKKFTKIMGHSIAKHYDVVHVKPKDLAEGKHTSTIAAMAAHAYEPQVGHKIETRKGGQIPGTVTKVDNGQVYFTHPNGKTYKTHAGNVRRVAEETINERGENKYKRATEKGAGITKAGAAKYRREHPGSKLSTAVTTEPSKLKHGSKAWNRRKSFCARMGGMKGPMKDSKGRPTRKAMSLRRWHCE